jgi:hypothetical protein
MLQTEEQMQCYCAVPNVRKIHRLQIKRALHRDLSDFDSTRYGIGATWSSNGTQPEIVTI